MKKNLFNLTRVEEYPLANKSIQNCLDAAVRKKVNELGSLPRDPNTTGMAESIMREDMVKETQRTFAHCGAQEEVSTSAQLYYVRELLRKAAA